MSDELQGKTGDNNIDPLLLKKVYPDAHEVFQFRPKTLDEIFGKAVVVLDTRPLLVPYGLGETGLNEIEKCYERLIQAKRLVVPAHVAREFGHQRAEKIKNIYSALSKARNQSRPNTDYPVLMQMTEFADLAAAEKEVDASFAKRNEVIDRVLAQMRAWRWDDPVTELYRKLFTKDVVVESDVEDSKARADCNERLGAKIPPGFKDADKSRNAAGDVLVWHTVLTVGRARPKADVVFVSGDAKNDWFYRSENTALYPRFELTDEYRRASDGGSFHILPFPDFLKRMNASASVVLEAQVQEFFSISSDRPKHHWGFHAETAVARWLVKQGYALVASRHLSRRQFPDFIAVSGESADTVGVAIKLVSSRPLWADKLRDVIARSNETPGLYHMLKVVFVALNPDNAQSAFEDLGGPSLRDGLDRPVEVQFGYIGTNGEFILIGQ
jgi:PIN like domain